MHADIHHHAPLASRNDRPRGAVKRRNVNDILLGVFMLGSAGFLGVAGYHHIDKIALSPAQLVALESAAKNTVWDGCPLEQAGWQNPADMTPLRWIAHGLEQGRSITRGDEKVIRQAIAFCTRYRHPAAAAATP
ncbi:hypothetical protein [Noviherbaspirillum pedocola]|uniref:Uncharacterized protein n=1 Tax=Noviherbaspirillum pedocola TaxID=2801341 RepID=A0A934T0C3_9BURK|nr:hypothetical protein [Noviherbaspirillum pedocola]MBK4736139.1 hypothetical protein [Noviherbaspirillum pedocola]